MTDLSTTCRINDRISRASRLEHDARIRELINDRIVNGWPVRLGKPPHTASFQYYRYASFENEIWHRNGKLIDKLHWLLESEPIETQCGLIRILFDKLFRL